MSTTLENKTKNKYVCCSCHRTTADKCTENLIEQEENRMCRLCWDLCTIENKIDLGAYTLEDLGTGKYILSKIRKARGKIISITLDTAVELEKDRIPKMKSSLLKALETIINNHNFKGVTQSDFDYYSKEIIESFNVELKDKLT